MPLCNSSIYNFIVTKHFDSLETLSPLKRASEIFKLEIEALSYVLNDTDEIFGWFVFEDNGYKSKQFTDCIPDNDTQKILDLPQLHGSKTALDKSHTLVDYEYILKNGLNGYFKEIEQELEKYPDNEYLLAMKDTLFVTKSFIEKILVITNEKLATYDIPPKNLLEIKSALEQVPFYPARNFKEALQAVWIIHFLTPLAENAWYSISLGKFDRYIYPFYKKSLSEGMSKTEAKKILYNFYKLLNSYSDGACVLNVGGKEYNEFSELIIDCQAEFSFPAPILAARITKDTPEHIWNMLIDERLFCAGQPTFYGEDSCILALEEKGLTFEEASRFSNNSCMGISLAGEEFNSMWGCVFSVSAAFEAAINNGHLLNGNFFVPGISPVENIADVYLQFEKSLSYLLDICINSYNTKAIISEKYDPDPFVSLLTKDCIKKHRDRISGARYHNVTIECMGMINVSDGLCAIDKLVFSEKKYTLEELTNAVKNNFKNNEKVLTDILSCPKYGQNSEADLYAVKIAKTLQKVIRSKNHDNVIFAPSLHTLDSNVSYGKDWGAGYDGRLLGTPFAKNAGASNCVRKKDPTSLILSASKLPQHQFYGGQPIDLNFPVNIIKNHKKEIANLIKVYLENGGLQLQVNSLSSKILKDAVKNPENYQDLIVRIGGYSDYFKYFAKATQQEFIERIEYEEG